MHHFLFGVFPYIAISVMIVGSIIRYDRDPFTWKSGSSQILRKKQFVIGSVLFHLGVLVILFGHIAGLLLPMKLYEIIGISHGFKQVMAITVGGLGAVSALIGGAILLRRRLYDPRIRANSTFADTGIMILLMVQLVLGFCTIFVSLNHLDGGEMVQLMKWAQGIVYFGADPAAHILGTSVLFKAHILVGLIIFMVFPFTRLIHIISAPVRYLWRPGFQIVRTRQGAKPAHRGLAPMPRRTE